MNLSLRAPLFRFGTQRQVVFSLIIVTALIAFEMFNFGTTLFAFSDLLGDLSFIGMRWAAILAFAFCAIDFAGIARLFSPLQQTTQNHETWYLFSAWLLAASMNAVLTWWGISLALLNHETLGSDLIDRSTLLTVVPVFVAVLIWLIRVLIIGTFSTSGPQLFSNANSPHSRSQAHRIVVPKIPHTDAPIQPDAHTYPEGAHAVITPVERNGRGSRYNPPVNHSRAL